MVIDSVQTMYKNYTFTKPVKRFHDQQKSLSDYSKRLFYDGVVTGERIL
jgi:hypothetical protein